MSIEPRCPVCGSDAPALPDGSCARCRVAPERTLADLLTDAREEDEEASRRPPAAPGHRVAGAVFVLNALLSVVVFASLLVRGADSPVLLSPVAALIDFGIGLSLLSGTQQLRVWAIVRCLVGGLVYPVILVVTNKPAEAALQVVFSGSLVALLLGTPGKTRTAIATAAVMVVACLEVLGVVGTVRGGGFTKTSDFTAASDPIEGSLARGRRAPWHLAAPPGWRRLKPDTAAKLNPAADVWLVDPERGASLIVITEVIANATHLDVESLTSRVAELMKSSLSKFELLERTELETSLEGARLVHVRGVASGQDIEYEIGVFTRGNTLYRVMAWSGPESFPKLQGEYVRMIRSFELDAR